MLNKNSERYSGLLKPLFPSNKTQDYYHLLPSKKKQGLLMDHRSFSSRKSALLVSKSFWSDCSFWLSGVSDYSAVWWSRCWQSSSKTWWMRFFRVISRVNFQIVFSNLYKFWSSSTVFNKWSLILTIEASRNGERFKIFAAFVWFAELASVYCRWIAYIPSLSINQDSNNIIFSGHRRRLRLGEYLFFETDNLSLFYFSWSWVSNSPYSFW